MKLFTILITVAFNSACWCHLHHSVSNFCTQNGNLVMIKIGFLKILFPVVKQLISDLFLWAPNTTVHTVASHPSCNLFSSIFIYLYFKQELNICTVVMWNGRHTVPKPQKTQNRKRNWVNVCMCIKIKMFFLLKIQIFGS